MAATLAVLAWMIGATSLDAAPVFAKEGLGLFFGTEWDPGNARDGTISGTWRQGGVDTPFVLRRAAQ